MSGPAVVPPGQNEFQARAARSASTGPIGARAVPRRRGGLLLLVAALAVSAAGWLIVDSVILRRVDGHAGWLLGGDAAAWRACYGAARRLAPAADRLLLPCCALLDGLGLVMTHRIDLARHAQHGAEGTADATLQVIWTLVGLVVLVGVLAAVRDHRRLARYAYTAELVALVLVVLPAALPARISEVNGAKLWIRLGGLSLQPGEFAKLAATVFFAAYLANKRDLLIHARGRVAGVALPRGRDLGPLIAVWAVIVVVLVAEKDVGMAVLVFAVFSTCLYLGSGRAAWLLVGCGLFAALCVAAYFALPHVHLRITVWRRPFAHPASGYQIQQSLFGLGTGGLFGTGLAAGHPYLVPLARSDFILAAFGEELGLVGLTAILLVYALLVARGLRIGQLTRDTFGRLLAAALSVTLAYQVFIIGAGVSNLLPETGLATPLLSYGGSALVANLALVGLLLRISDRAERLPVATQPTPPSD